MQSFNIILLITLSVILIIVVYVLSTRIKVLENALEEVVQEIDFLNKKVFKIHNQLDLSSKSQTKPSDKLSPQRGISPKEFTGLDTGLSDLKRLGKGATIYFINKDQDRYDLTTSNTRFSNINSTVPVWWFDIPIELFKQDLHLLLKGKRQLYWLRLPKGTFDLPQRYFYIRQDNGKVQLRISTEPGRYFMCDTAPTSRGIAFEKYVVKIYK
ncbi:hypothetical protein [Formosa algae]|uniref:Uncharacterized protein n=1 Tax=Formosa algae TaxID=225843 RepID=A0A9X1C9L2_9FLAO|nr:hypothetical protein [Formosa algae]MBP1840498.1 hypothetical protein [Formosa algae]MDQ0336089.1 hypothetical protein [Formosa algae]OEI81029.1 hypothetical protein AST99_05035 [Formosa algae]